MDQKLTERERNAQMKKEALISVAMYVIFFLWWYFTGYGLAGENQSYTMGIPNWFLLSSVVGYVLFSAATIIVVKLFFKNFSLEEAADDPEAAKK
ncbi:MAG: YhdT family protein [Candidatus Adiutrix sp.]|jgi:uncharacterized membrane protein YhdT|nr:YhdT family protein [Candidatus Adiutrix sp.]